MEPQPQHQAPDIQTSGKTKKEMGRWNKRFPQAKAEDIFRMIQFDQHATWTAWSWMGTRWRTSRCQTPRTRLTSIDTAADIAHEPRHEIKHQRIEAQKGWWAQTISTRESAAFFFETSFCQMNPWIPQLCSSFLFFSWNLLEHVCRRHFEFNRFCHIRCLMIFFHAWLCTLSWTEYRKSSLLFEQGVQTYQILFVWDHDPSTHVRSARFLIHIGDFIWVCHCHCHCQDVRWTKLIFKWNP